MKDIDWNEAPEGATHAYQHGDENITWYKDIKENSYSFRHKEHDEWHEIINTGTPESPVWHPLIPRPTQWRGPQDGLPPIGYTQDDCAMVHLDESDKFTVVAHHHGYAIVAFGPGPKEGTVISTAAKVDEFRIVLSQRERDITAIQTASQGKMGAPVSATQAINLHDAGYRKPMSRTDAHQAIVDICKASDEVIRFSVRQQLLDALGFKE